MATKVAKQETTDSGTVSALVEKLGMDPKSDTAVWIRQQQEDGVKDADILASLATSDVAPATTRRVPRDA